MNPATLRKEQRHSDNFFLGGNFIFWLFSSCPWTRKSVGPQFFSLVLCVDDDSFNNPTIALLNWQCCEWVDEMVPLNVPRKLHTVLRTSFVFQKLLSAQLRWEIFCLAVWFNMPLSSSPLCCPWDLQWTVVPDFSLSPVSVLTGEHPHQRAELGEKIWC